MTRSGLLLDDCLVQVRGRVADVLGIDEVDVAADTVLTELGLESFSAVQLRRGLRAEFDVELPLTAFLAGATARSLTREVLSARDADGGEHHAAEGALVADGGSSDPAGPFPLTPIQAAYLVGRDESLPLGGVGTYFYFEYDRRPDGDAGHDLLRLEAALNRLVARHPMLRMVVGADGRQRVLDDVPAYRIPVEDLGARDVRQCEQALSQLRAACSHRVLPLDRWPLFEVRAALLPDGSTRVCVGMDIIALDLASWQQVMREWGQLAAQPELVLPEPPSTFAALVTARDHDPRVRARREQDHAYWTERLPTLPGGPALPWSRVAADLGVPHFVRPPSELTAQEWGAIRRLAASHGVSPTAVLLAACALTLDRWGATEPFCLNTTLFDRPEHDGDADADAVVGDFTTTVLTEAPVLDVTTWAGFAEYAAAMNHRLWADMDHRSVSAVEVTRGARGADLTPTHPVVFTSGVGLPGDDESPTGWIGTEVFGVSQTPQVLIDHIVWVESGRLRVAWDVVDGCLPDGFAAGMRDAHLHLLRRLAGGAAAWADAALGWDPSFRPDRPVDCAPFGDVGPLVADPLNAVGADAPSRVALIGPDRQVTHGELAELARSTGAALRELGVGPGDLVAVAAQKGIAQVAATLGVSASGAGYVPVEPDWPAPRIAAVCSQADVAHALAPEGGVTAWPDDVQVHQMTSDGTLGGGSASRGASTPAASDDLAYVI
ncbi:MAG: AMP-binding protein, partial [Phycicoccus sp.]